jgi:hypothetical protein
MSIGANEAYCRWEDRKLEQGYSLSEIMQRKYFNNSDQKNPVNIAQWLKENKRTTAIK